MPGDVAQRDRAESVSLGIRHGTIAIALRIATRITNRETANWFS